MFVKIEIDPNATTGFIDIGSITWIEFIYYNVPSATT